MTAYSELMAFDRTTRALVQVAGRLGWDQETMMPEGAVDQRSEEHGAMAAVLHARRTDQRIGEWLAKADPVDDTARANLRHITREFERTNRVPAALAV